VKLNKLENKENGKMGEITKKYPNRIRRWDRREGRNK
jgi:hypothetical protein